MTAKRTVYCFVRYAAGGERSWHSIYPATLEAIQALDGVPLTDTAIEVDEALIDPDGRYFGPANCAHPYHPPAREAPPR